MWGWLWAVCVWTACILYDLVCMFVNVICLLYGIPFGYKVAVTVVLIFYWYSTWTFGLFRVQNIPGPTPWPVLGNLWPILTKGVRVSDSEHIRRYGKVVGLYEGRTPVLLVADTDMLRHIFVTHFSHFHTRRTAGLNEYPFCSALTRLQGAHWKHVRSLITPAFSTAKLKQTTSHISSCAEILVDNLKHKAASRETVNIREHCGAFSMDVIARSAFGLELDSQTDQHNPFVTYANKFFHTLSVVNPIALVLLVFPFCVSILKWLQIRIMPSDAIHFFIQIIDDTIAARKHHKQKTSDFLQILIDAEEKRKSATESQLNNQKPLLNGHCTSQNTEPILNVAKHYLSERTDSIESEPDFGIQKSDSIESIPDLTLNQLNQSCIKRVGLTLEEIHAQSLIFFIAGYETTATSLSYIAYCLATNPQCQEKLIAEIEANFTQCTHASYEEYNQLVYLDMCIHEALRLYPPAPRTTRVCSEDVEVGDIVIQRGMLVAIPIYHLHMDPEMWPEPEKFIPERFSSSSSCAARSYSYLPFGAGPRKCVGSRLALLELKVATVHLLRHFRIIPGAETQIPLSFKKKGLLQPEKDIMLTLEPRIPL